MKFAVKKRRARRSFLGPNPFVPVQCGAEIIVLGDYGTWTNFVLCATITVTRNETGHREL
jgi:hypothetical protein